MNPNAASFTFRPGAASFTPGGAAAAPPPAPAPAATPAAPPANDDEEIVLGAGSNQGEGAGDAGEEDDEEMDENDPLWKAFLTLAGGDKKKATSMLEEPDSYMHLPEIQAAMAAADAAGGGDVEDWEKADDAPVPGVGSNTTGADAEESAPPPAAKPAAEASSSSALAKSSGAAANNDGDDDDSSYAEEDEADEDPREHLNLGEYM